MRYVRRFGAVVLLGLAACGERASSGLPTDPPDPPTMPTVAARYPLYLADGRQLPTTFLDVVFQTPTGELHLELRALGGFLDLKADGTYTHQVVKTGLVDGEPAPIGNWNDHGTWTVFANGIVTLTSELFAGHVLEGTVDGAILRFNQDLSGEDGNPFPVRFVYRR